jgi:hypothetical protein
VGESGWNGLAYLPDGAAFGAEWNVTTLMDILESPWTLVFVMITGPLLLWWTVKRSNAGRASKGKGRPDAAKSGTAVPAGRREVVPGFRDVRWGESPLPDMVVVHQASEEKLCSRRGDELMLDGAPLNSILYSFHKDRLQAVMIDMPLGSGDRVLRGRTAGWGVPRQPNLSHTRYFWLDLLDGMDATQAVLERNHATAKSSLIISSKYIKESRDRERAASPDA